MTILQTIKNGTCATKVDEVLQFDDFYRILLPKFGMKHSGIDEVSHNSKATQAKAVSMYSVAGRIYHISGTSSQHAELQNPVPQLYLKLDKA